MAQISLEQAKKINESERIKWHKSYLKKYGVEKTKDLLVKELRSGKSLPQDMKLKEYVDKLVAEIAEEDAKNQQ